MKVHLLIQRTFAGLNTEYTSNPAIAQLDNKLFLTDERSVVMQITENPVFSFAKNEKWTCYSFIKRALDREKRAGFYAIRLFISSAHKLTNVKDCLLTIAQRYELFIQNNTPSQEYTDLLTQIDEKAIIEKERYTFDIESIRKGTYYAIATAENLEALFADERNEFVEKLYLFTTDIDSKLLAEFHLHSIDPLSVVKWQINDEKKALDKLWLENTAIPVFAKQLLSLQGAKLYFQLKGQQEKRELTGTNELKTTAVIIDDADKCITSLKINNTAVKPQPYFELYALATDTLYYTLKNGKEIPLPITAKLSTRKLIVENSENALAKLWVNGEELPIPTGKKFEIYALTTDKIEYTIVGQVGKKTTVNSDIKTLSIHLPNRGQTINDNKKSPVIDILLYALLSLLVGGIIGYFYRSNTSEEDISAIEQKIQEKEAKYEQVKKELNSFQILPNNTATKTVTSTTKTATKTTTNTIKSNNTATKTTNVATKTTNTNSKTTK